MTVFRLKTDPVSGNLAIYSVPDHASTDNAPLTDPFADPSRLQFHSGMICPSGTPPQVVTVTIPAQPADTKFSGQINLFAHGKGEPCMVEGRFGNPDNPGQWVAFNGTMPIKVTTTGHAIWLALCATDTHVSLIYFGVTHSAISSFTMDVEAQAFDYLASGPADNSDPGLPIMRHVPNSFLQMGRGKVDTRRRYLRHAASGNDFWLATSPTLTIVGFGTTDQGGRIVAGGSVTSKVQLEWGWRWRYSCGGYVRGTSVGWNGDPVADSGCDGEFIAVKR